MDELATVAPANVEATKLSMPKDFLSAEMSVPQSGLVPRGDHGPGSNAAVRGSQRPANTGITHMGYSPPPIAVIDAPQGMHGNGAR